MNNNNLVTDFESSDDFLDEEKLIATAVEIIDQNNNNNICLDGILDDIRVIYLFLYLFISSNLILYFNRRALSFMRMNC